MMYRLDHPCGETVELILFKNVRNTPEVRNLIMTGKLDAAALKASLILDTFPVLVAAQHAMSKLYTGTLASRTVSSEIVYNMSAVRNIGKALTLFGLSDACESILFVLVGPTKTALTALEDLVDGALVEDVSAGLRAGVDLDAVQKIYDLTDAEVRAGTLVDSIVTRIAVRDMK